MNLETLINQLQNHLVDGEDYTVTCNRISNVPLVTIKNNKGKVIRSIDLRKNGELK